MNNTLSNWPLGASLIPLIGINVLFLLTVIFFRITYREQTKTTDVDLKEHSKFLSRFFKHYWYWLTSPFTRLMIHFRIAPNVITLWGFLICCVSGYFFSKGMLGAGGWFMIFGATFDMFDGLIARMTGQESKSGAFFDSVMDRFSEGVVFLGLAILYRSSWVLIFVIAGLIGSMMVSYTRARGEGVGVDVKIGIMQRPERIVYLSVGSIFSPIFAYLLSSYLPVRVDFMTVGAIVIIAVMTNLTAIYRMKYVMGKLNTAPRQET